MNVLALKQLELVRKIEKLPAVAMDSINRYLDQFQSPQPSVTRNRSLKGIWKHQGFERIPDLEGELKTLRTELSVNLQRRQF